MGKAVWYTTNIINTYDSKPGHIEKCGVQQRLVCSHSHPVFPSQLGPWISPQACRRLGLSQPDRSTTIEKRSKLKTHGGGPWFFSGGSLHSWSPLSFPHSHELWPRIPGPHRIHCSWPYGWAGGLYHFKMIPIQSVPVYMYSRNMLT